MSKTHHRKHSLLQNIAAISGDFHTHKRYWEFYETFGKNIDGFVGQYDICIGMAKALTDWENANGGLDAYDRHGLIWIEIVEQYVAAVLDRSIESAQVMNDYSYILRSVIRKARSP